jgi:hypothetical protein
VVEHGCGVVVGGFSGGLVVLGVEMNTVTAVRYEKCWCRRKEEGAKRAVGFGPAALR